MILNVNNPVFTNSKEKDRTDFYFASAHFAGFGLMFYGTYIGLAYGKVAGLWMALLGLVVFRLTREIYSRSLVTRALHGKPAAEFMDTEAESVDPTTPLSEIMRKVRDGRLIFPVARNSDHAFVGLADVRSSEQFPAGEWRAHQVAEITKPCARDLLVEPEDDAESVLQKMQTLGLREVLVVKGGRLLGVLSLNSLLNRIQDRFALPSSNMHAAT